jgi:NAD(P)-dependent dehydrogenase (short-subunit alcohol dehydrogenase family)
MGRLDGKVAIITGSARGQGEIHAKVFAKEGAKVVAADILDEEGEKVAQQIRGDGCVGSYLHLDVTKAGDWQKVIQKTVSEYGKLDILVNNAAILNRKPIEETTEKEWENTMRVNVMGIFLGIKYSIPAMRKAGGGSIINISSVAGIRASFVADAAYSASKGAIAAITRTVGVQYAGENIRCNTVSPAHIDAPMLHKAHTTPERFAAVAKHVPLGRIGKREEVSYAVVHLASDESGFTTGAELVVDVGMHARY